MEVYCSENNRVKYACSNKNCDNYALMCDLENCSCRGLHLECKKLDWNLEKRLKNNIMKKHQHFDQVKSEMLTFFKQIDIIRSEAEVKFQEWIQNFGLSLQQKQFYQKIKGNNLQGVKGSQIYEIDKQMKTKPKINQIDMKILKKNSIELIQQAKQIYNMIEPVYSSVQVFKRHPIKKIQNITKNTRLFSDKIIIVLLSIIVFLSISNCIILSGQLEEIKLERNLLNVKLNQFNSTQIQDKNQTKYLRKVLQQATIDYYQSLIQHKHAQKTKLWSLILQQSQRLLQYPHIDSKIIESTSRSNSQYMSEFEYFKSEYEYFTDFATLLLDRQYLSGFSFKQIIYEGDSTLQEFEDIHQTIKKAASNFKRFYDEINKKNAQTQIDFLLNMIQPRKGKVKGWKLLYRASQNNFNHSRFIQVAKQTKPTLVLVETQSNKKIGGFTDCYWLKQNVNRNQTFIFSITNREQLFPINNNRQILVSTNSGPSFSEDLMIMGRWIYSKIGQTYNNGRYTLDSTQSQIKWIGKSSFSINIKEWEFYEVQFYKY